MNLSLTLLYDSSTNLWVITDSNIPGLVTEAPTLEKLGSKLDIMIPELIELNQPNTISWDSIKDEVLQDSETLREYLLLGPEFEEYKHSLNCVTNYFNQYDIKPEL